MSLKLPDDPDPFVETPLDAVERREMLEKLAAYMKPILQPATDESRAQLRAMWDDLREQETVESFKVHAELVLAALQDLADGGPPKAHVDRGGGRRKPPPKKVGGFLEPVTEGATLGDWDRPVLRDLPPASFPNK